MSRLVIKSIVIVDHLNKLANKFNFSEKSNIITSQENEVGKSSLLKSIYYTLGAQIKTFPNGWKYKNYIFQLTCKIDEREMIIQRYNKVFLVKENKDRLLCQESGHKSTNKFDFQFKLLNLIFGG